MLLFFTWYLALPSFRSLPPPLVSGQPQLTLSGLVAPSLSPLGPTLLPFRVAQQMTLSSLHSARLRTAATQPGSHCSRGIQRQVLSWMPRGGSQRCGVRGSLVPAQMEDLRWRLAQGTRGPATGQWSSRSQSFRERGLPWRPSRPRVLLQRGGGSRGEGFPFTMGAVQGPGQRQALGQEGEG